MPAPDINQLVHGFAEHIRELKSPTTTEATVRQNYINPFWRALGWDVGNSKQLGPAEAEIIAVRGRGRVGIRGSRYDASAPFHDGGPPL